MDATAASDAGMPAVYETRCRLAADQRPVYDVIVCGSGPPDR